MTWRKIILIIIGSFLVSFASYYLFNRFIRKSSTQDSPAALHVESLGKPLTVVLDNNILGKTPFHSESLKEGVSSFVLSSEESSLRTKINLVSSVLTVVNWDLGPVDIFSEGEIIWMEKVSDKPSLVVFGNPEGAEVRLDDEFLGTIPISSDKVAGGDHSVKISKIGYKARTVKIKIQDGYKLSIKFQLFLIPGTNDLSTIPFSSEVRYTIRDLSSSDPLLYSDTRSWVRGLSYFLGKSDAPPSGDKKVDYYFDYQGIVFDPSGFKVADNSEIVKAEKLSLGYLGRKSDSGITEEARKSMVAFAQRALISQNLLQILPTGSQPSSAYPNGWLRVRASPSLAGEEVARVGVGDKVIFLDEQGSWYQIKLPDGKIGWISAAFAKKL